MKKLLLTAPFFARGHHSRQLYMFDLAECFILDGSLACYATMVPKSSLLVEMLLNYV